MKKVIGIDLGTSSIKCFAAGFGEPVVLSASYDKDGPKGMISALADMFGRLGGQIDLKNTESIGMTGQAGSYITAPRDNLDDIRLWLPWHTAGRETFLKKVLAEIDCEAFFAMTGMYHPNLTSYPLPNILYIKNAYPGMLGDCVLLQPKDWLCALLTGSLYSDAASWRGLADWDAEKYVPELIKYAGIDENRLPVIQKWAQIDKNGASLTGLCEGTPVCVGYSDFYSALVGMDIKDAGTCFDITGTSEHFGVTAAEAKPTPLIIGRFGAFGLYAHYGVTASSGRALNMARTNLGFSSPDANGGSRLSLREKAPIFLPYVRGERAPVFDSGARGVFCGISENCKQEDLSYSICEGVVFSLYDIYQKLGCPEINHIKTTGKASGAEILGILKASLFGVPVIGERPDCGSAMGAVKMAGGEWEREQRTWEPDLALGGRLRYRFEVYKRMYNAWRDMTDGLDTRELFW
ncbi:MAG: FGGY-family carbohydrate kinase [Oscillospiraceae bacterium]|nr:FGGY-family carbohydrate kinase [Oscillospiraceae bacterium]